MSRSAYHFAGFVVSPARRQLLRDGRELPLIPRYFDLLVLLIDRRREAVRRHELLDTVWSDVVVGDSALNQAVRTLRRVLGDDPRQPSFIRTVARHGYQFVHPDVREVAEPDAVASTVAPAMASPLPDDGAIDAALVALFAPRAGPDLEEERREAAQTLLRLDAQRARRLLEARGDAAHALATLRDARWEVAGAAPVPFLGHAGMWRNAWELARLRVASSWALVRRRWGAAVVGGAGAGLVAGALGGCALWLGPGATSDAALPLALAVVGMVIGALGAAGVAAGLALGEVTFRAWRGSALVVGGALGGGATGALTHGLAALLLQGLFGRDLSAVAGGFEGVAIGAAIGLGYALATPRPAGGLATPTGLQRLGAALLTGAVCALTTGLLGWHGSFLGAMSLDLLADTFPGSAVGLGPLARLLGEENPGAVTRVAVSAWEGLAFGTGLVFGLTHRPRVVSQSGAE